jgi:hypothetical protein
MDPSRSRAVGAATGGGSRAGPPGPALTAIRRKRPRHRRASAHPVGLPIVSFLRPKAPLLCSAPPVPSLTSGMLHASICCFLRTAFRAGFLCLARVCRPGFGYLVRFWYVYCSRGSTDPGNHQRPQRTVYAWFLVFISHGRISFWFMAIGAGIFIELKIRTRFVGFGRICGPYVQAGCRLLLLFGSYCRS